MDYYTTSHFGGVDLVLKGIPRIRGNTEKKGETTQKKYNSIKKHRKNSILCMNYKKKCRPLKNH